MPQLTRKRRAPTEQEDSESGSSSPPARRRISTTQSQSRPQSRPQTRPQSHAQNHHTRSPPTSPSPTPDPDPDAHPTSNNSQSTSHQTRLLTRLALSTSTTRSPLRRPDINARCGTTPSTFRTVFADAQLALREVFGMQLVELPGREKISVADRRREAATQSQRAGAGGGGGRGAGTKSWILTSCLPPEMRTALGEHIYSNSGKEMETEAGYLGLHTFIITLITLSGGALAENKLLRHLEKLNAHRTTVVDTTEKTLGRMVREGYILRVREEGEEGFEYRVGVRGKVEVGDQGVGGLVRGVHGFEEVPDAEGEMEREGRVGQGLELEGRIERSLALGKGRGEAHTQTQTQEGGGPGNGAQNGIGRGEIAGARKKGRAARAREEEEEEEEEEHQDSD